MTAEERDALARSFLGKAVTIKIDRPIGYIHKKERYTLEYKINYGYVPNVIGGDGEELDVYLLGVDVPVDTFTGRVIAIAHREDDVEDKLVMAPDGMSFTPEEIRSQIEFQEKYYTTTIEPYTEKSE